MNRRTYAIMAAIMLVGMAGSTVIGVYASDLRSPPSQPSLSPVGTDFTYQGSLSDTGSLANGPYDLQFLLYDDASAGSQVGGTVVKADVPVAEGYFTAELDFGDVFDGTAYWLEIWVRPGASSGGYQQLLPRQKMTSAPFASNANRLDGMDSADFALVADVVPAGAVMSFNLTSCPSGWTEVTAAQGRAIVGLPSGGTLNGSVGTGLSDVEDRSHSHPLDEINTSSGSVGNHAHDVNPSLSNTGPNGSHSHTYNPTGLFTTPTVHNHAWAYINSNSNWRTWNSNGTSTHEMVNYGDGTDTSGDGYYPVSVTDSLLPVSGNFYQYTQQNSHTHIVDIPQESTSSENHHGHSVDLPSQQSTATGGHDHVIYIPTSNTDTASTSDVMPYIQFLVCEKD